MREFSPRRVCYKWGCPNFCFTFVNIKHNKFLGLTSLPSQKVSLLKVLITLVPGRPWAQPVAWREGGAKEACCISLRYFLFLVVAYVLNIINSRPGQSKGLLYKKPCLHFVLDICYMPGWLLSMF